MSKLIDLIHAHQRRRSGLDDDLRVRIHDELPACTRGELAQILREIDGGTRGLPAMRGQPGEGQ
jgi:hypothetical protein